MNFLPILIKWLSLGVVWLLSQAHSGVAIFRPNAVSFTVTAVPDSNAAGYVGGQSYIFRLTASPTTLFNFDVYYINGTGVVGDYLESNDPSYQTLFQAPEKPAEGESPRPYAFSATIDLSAGEPFFGLQTPGGNPIIAFGGHVEVPDDYTSGYGYSWEKTQRDYGPVPPVFPTSSNSAFSLSYLDGNLPQTINFSMTNFVPAPEPSSALLGMLGLATLLRRRRG